jgi:alpha-L-rhamnosidase
MSATIQKNESTAELPEWSTLSSATWISGPVCGGPRTTAPALYYRQSFHVSEIMPRRALLQITALGLFEAEINGQRVGADVFAPGWTDYHTRVYYHTYDVTSLLHPGENVIGVILGDGWYSGHIATDNRQKYGEQPMLVASIEDHSDSKPTVLAATDKDWQYSRGPILENDLIMGESYDARRELGPWSSPGYAATGWQPVNTCKAPAIAVERSPGPPVQRQETLPGTLMPMVRSNPWEAARCRYDFGQNFSGRVRIRVSGPRGLHLNLRFAEVLNPDGSLYTDNLRGARATDYYTLKGEGVEEYEPRFTFHGFRYLEINWQGKFEDLKVVSADGIVLHSNMARSGHFECSNPLLNQLASNILWGQKSNFLEVPTDCPQRDERLGWTGDAQVFIRTAAFFMDVRGFFHKWMQDMRDAQCKDGAVPAIIPCTGAFGLGGDGNAAWADATFICPWTIYLCYGDKSILGDHYESMTGYMDYLAQFKVKDYIRSHPDLDHGGFGDWLALDGSGRTDGITPKDLIGTAYYAYDADIMARTAELLGKKADAERYRTLHQNIVKAFTRRFVTGDGLLTSSTQTAYVLALHFGLVAEALRPAAARELVRLIERNGNHIGTGFVGTPYILHVLEANGYLDVAYRLLEQESFPSWLFPVKNGATTIWERWDGWTPDKGFQDKGMNSFNHYAYGAVGDWMVSGVAGLDLDPAEPGYKHVRFKPRPGGSLTYARAKLNTSRGTVAIAWKLDANRLDLELEVPPGSRATLDLPTACNTAPLRLEPGRHQLNFHYRNH